MTMPPGDAVTQPEEAEERSLGPLIRLFLKLGIIGFGGPLAHVALMEEEVVRRRRWISRDHFLDALAATNLIPGPNSTEMGIHIGYLRGGPLGAVGAGVAFILPAFLLMLGLSWAYFRFGTEPAVESVFYGVQAAVIGIVAAAAYRLARTAITDVFQAALLVLAFLAVAALRLNEVLVLLAAGLAGLALYGGLRAVRPPTLPWAPALLPVLALMSADAGTLGRLAWSLFRAGALLFGGGYVIIPFLEGDAVHRYGWLTEQEFLSGIALGQVTPGPIVITSTFVGYGAAGWPGAVVATVAVFLPSFLLVLALAPLLMRLRQSGPLRAFLKGVNPAVVGTIAAATLLLAGSAIVDVWTAGLAAAALALTAVYRLNVVYLIAGSAAAGLFIDGWLR
jgi:chromate transporter